MSDGAGRASPKVPLGLVRFAPGVAIVVMILPVAAGLAGVVLPAFGYLPVLGGTSFTLEPWRLLFEVPGLGRSVALSFTAGLVTTLLSFTVVQFFVAAWHGTRLFMLLRQALSPLLSVPHAAAAFGLAFLIAPSGWLVRLFSPWATGFVRPPDVLVIHDPYAFAMMAGLVAKEAPFLFLMTLAAMPQTDAPRLARVATSFGYGRIAGWLKVSLPLLYPQIRLPILAVVAYSSSVVDVALILGPTLPPPLSVQLLHWMNAPDLAMRFVASAGALLQLGVTAAALCTWLVAERLVACLGSGWSANGRRYQHDGLARWAIAMATGALVLAMILALCVLVLWSVSGFWPFPASLPPKLTFATWVQHLPRALGPVFTTLWLALAAVVIAGVLAVACLEQEVRSGRTPARKALGLLYVPLLVPQIAFLFGLQFLLIATGLSASPMALVFVHFLFVLPYVFLSLGDPWRAWDPRYGRVAAGFGASPRRIFWQIRLPMLLRALLSAGAVGFAVSIGQYLPTLLVGEGRYTTVTTEAVTLASGGDRRLISLYAILQMALPLCGFLVAIVLPSIVFRNRRAMRAGN